MHDSRVNLVPMAEASILFTNYAVLEVRPTIDCNTVKIVAYDIAVSWIHSHVQMYTYIL